MVYDDDMKTLPTLRNYSRQKKNRSIIIRLNDHELEVLKKKAERWTGGNSSDFTRHAILNWSPEEEDKDEREAS